MFNLELQNGYEIYHVSDNGTIRILHVKQVKKDGLVVSARLVDDEYRYLSNLIVGHKNTRMMVGEDGIYYVDKNLAEIISRKNHNRESTNNFLYHLEKLGLDVTISSQSLIELIGKGIKI